VEHFDAVIVGSGFGGSVMAHRLSESKQRVCVLERGKAYPPLSFPRSPHDFARNFWDPSDGKYGMFDIWSFKGTEAVVSSGLGGGSLIYANVLIRKDEKWFVKENLAQGGYEYWPVTRQDLEPHYDRVEQMLGAQQYPLGHSPYDKTHKTIAFRDAAKELGYDWFLPKLAVTFGNPGDLPKPGVLITGEPENYHRAQRFTCRLCGECDAGCNYGSKNTLDYNYLSAAWRNGATIRTLSEVRGLRPRPGKSGYEIDYAVHSPDGGKRISTKDIPLTTISADRLILSAGTLGSTYLLLKNRHHFPNLSPRLGERFSTNGDLLSFAAKCTKEGQTRLIDPSHGPVITSSIRMGDALDGGQNEGRGFYLQDAGYPEFFNWIIETADAPGFLKRSLCFLWRRLKQAITHSPQSEITAQVSSLLGTGSDTVGTRLDSWQVR
jgi:cholesterol oxidase